MSFLEEVTLQLLQDELKVCSMLLWALCGPLQQQMLTEVLPHILLFPVQFFLSPFYYSKEKASVGC